MSDDQKIWFIYLTDHHEGPFTAGEIAEKAKAGLVGGQSLAWKDGMPEWVAAETIPELAAAMANAAAVAEVAAADQSGVSKNGNMIMASAAEAGAGGGEGEGVSLAQLLANQQQAGSLGVDPHPSDQIPDSAGALFSMASAVQAAAPSSPAAQKSGVTVGTGSISMAAGAAGPGLDDEAWTLRVGSQVSGLHSLRKLKELAAAGDIPPDAMVWHSGWSDFQAVSSVPQLEAVRKAKGAVARPGATGTRTAITRPGVAISAVPDSDDEPTDTELEAPPPSGFKGVLFKIHKLAEKLKKKKPKAAPARKEATKFVTAPGKGAAKKAGGGAGKRIGVLLVALLALAGGGGAAWFFLFSSPIPSSVDVSDDDLQSMVEVVKAKDAKKLYLAQAKGTEDMPPDPTAPKFFVATNLPEGATVTLALTGVPGTLVNRLSFEKSYTANVEKGHVAVFGKVNDDGKPLPWGEYTFKVTAEGADPLDGGKRFVGMKGGAYQKRLKTFKDTVQGDYDKEITELKEYIGTLKNLQAETSKQVAEYKQNFASPAGRAKITADWAGFTKNSQALLAQLDANLKARQAPDKAPKYHARAFQDVTQTVTQLTQLIKAHGERLGGATASANPDELDGLVQAGVQALEAWLAQAISKTPFDAHGPDAAKPATPPAAAAPSAPPPAAVPVPAAPAPAASPAPAVPPPAAPTAAAPGAK